MSDISAVDVGVVGLGGIGETHAKMLEQVGASLVGGMDVDPSAREAFTEEFDVETYDDHETLYDAVDAVFVTTPNRFHEEYAVDALDAGLDVLVEKPLAHTLEAAERVAAAARESDGVCMVGFHTRFENPVEALVADRDAGRFGDLNHVEASYIRRRGVPGRGSWFTQKSVAGGGALIDIGVHAVDLSLYLLGYPDVEEVTGVTRSQFGGSDEYSYLSMWGEDRGPENFDVEDSASAFVRCADGRSVSLEVAWAVNRPPKQEYVLRGTNAGATYRPGEELTVHEEGSGSVDSLVDASVQTRSNEPKADEDRYFLEHALAGEQPARNTAEQALTVQRVLDAIYRADETGRAVELAP